MTMIKWFTSQIRQIVGRIKQMLSDYSIEAGGILLPLGMGILVVSETSELPLAFTITGGVFAVSGLLLWLSGYKSAIRKDEPKGWGHSCKLHPCKKGQRCESHLEPYMPELVSPTVKG